MFASTTRFGLTQALAPMKQFLLLLSLALFPLHGNAQTVYKCTVNGATTYQSSPCQIGKQQSACADKRSGKAEFAAGTENGCKEKRPVPHEFSSRLAAPQTSSYGSTSSAKVSESSNASDSACPCSGGEVCTGPRGGRFCYTSGGNKRYLPGR